MIGGTFVFQDETRRIAAPLPGPLVVVPPGTELLSRSGNVIEARPIRWMSGDGVPDVLVGTMPLVTHVGGRIVVDRIDLPPPRPFRDDDVRLMYEEVQSAGLPPRQGVSLQGRMGSAVVTGNRSSSIEGELLPAAHAAALDLLCSWPQAESTTTSWRPTDVPGGREDERGTERRAGRWPSLRSPSGRILPSRSCRRLPDEQQWTSHGLHDVARRVSDELRRSGLPGGGAASDAFDAVARAARRPPGMLDPPRSAWPRRALSTYLLLEALYLSLARETSGIVPAPLSHLWALYEQWVESQVLFAIRSDLRMTPSSEPSPSRGCSWRAEFTGPAGRVRIVAQPVFTDDPSSCGPLSDIGLRSVSSQLIPDLVVAYERRDDASWLIDIYDAKKRTSPMDAHAVAESASKYLWGLRLGPDEPGRIGSVVRQALLVSTSPGGAMYDRGLAWIGAVVLLPSDAESRRAFAESVQSRY